MECLLKYCSKSLWKFQGRMEQKDDLAFIYSRETGNRDGEVSEGTRSYGGETI